MLLGKTILITGGTGSLGKALTRYILDHYEPKKIIIFSRDEFKHYEMRKEFNAKLIGDKTLRFMIGDIRDRWRLERAMKGVDICIHTAALKRIDDIEYNPDEAVKTNILGTLNVIEAAGTRGVETVIGITTDKAVKPINAYGISKAMGDRLLINANALYPKTKYILVRYGNVCDSRGSVIPIFRKAIKENRKIDITHSDMTRFCDNDSA